MNKTSPVEATAATVIGAAIFFVLGRFATIETPIPDTNISLQYAVMAVFALFYGPIVAGLIGFIGHFFIDVTASGAWSLDGVWWSWVIASAIAGIVMGVFMLKNRVQDGGLNKRTLNRFNVGILTGHAFAWILIAPLLDMLFYSEPAQKVFTQGAVAGFSNIITSCIVGSLIVVAYAKLRLPEEASGAE